MVKNPLANTGNIRDVGSIPGLGRFPGGGHVNPSQDSCWRIPGTEEPGGLRFTGLQTVGPNWSDLAQLSANFNNGKLHMSLNQPNKSTK